MSLLKSLEKATGRSLEKANSSTLQSIEKASATVNQNGRRIGNRGRDYRTDLKEASYQALGQQKRREVEEKYNKNPYGYGNIDLRKRPSFKNEDGSISTVSSMSFNEDGKEVLIPTIDFVDNKAVRLSDQEAIDRYRKTGEYLGKFNSIEESNKYAEELHRDQDYYFNFQPTLVQGGHQLVQGHGVTDEDKEIAKQMYDQVAEYEARETSSLGRTPSFKNVATDVGYSAEKLAAGATDAVSDAGSYLLALSAMAGRPFTWGSWNDSLKKSQEYWLDNATNGIGDQWNENIENRYKNVTDAYRNNIGNALYNIGAMAPAMVAEIASYGASPLLDMQVAGLGAKATASRVLKGALKSIKPSDAMFFLSAAGSSAGEGYNMSGNADKAMTYGALNGLGEVFTEKLFGGIGGTGYGDEIINLAKIPGIRKMAQNKVGGKVLDIGLEGVEEMIMSAADPVFQQMTVNPEATFANWGEVGESAKQGILVSVLMNAMLYPVNRYNRKVAIKTVNSSTDAINAILDNEAAKFVPLSENATEEEIKQRQEEIKAFRSAYVDALEEEVYKSNPELAKQTTSATLTAETQAPPVSATPPASSIEAAATKAAQANYAQAKQREAQVRNRLAQSKSKMPATLYAETLTQNGESLTVDEAMEASGFGIEGAKVLADYVDKNRGIPFSDVTGKTLVAYLAGTSNKVDFKAEPGSLQESMFEAGRRDRAISNVLAEKNKPTYVVFNGKESGAPRVNGKVVVPKGMSKTMATVFDLYGQISGRKVRFLDKISDADGNEMNAQITDDGYFDISLDLEEGLDYFNIFGHEPVHDFKRKNPNEYRILVDFAVQMEEGLAYRAKTGDSSGTNFEYIRGQYEEAGLPMNVHDNLDEIAARFFQKMVGSELDAKMIMKKAIQNRDTMTAMEKFMDAVETFIWKLGRLVRMLTNRGEYKAARELGMSLKQLEKARKLWQDTLKASAKETERILEEHSKAKTDTKSEKNNLEIKTKKDYNGKNSHLLKGSANSDAQTGVMWTIEDGVLTDQDVKLFYREVGKINYRDSKNFRMSFDGEYIFDINNKLIYTDGEYSRPIITKVVLFDSEYENDISLAKELILNEEGTQSEVDDAIEAIEMLYGQGFVIKANIEDSESYARQIRGRKGTDSGATSQSGKTNVAKKGSYSLKNSNKNYAPTFYSHMGKVVDEIKQDKIGASSVVSYLKGRGVKDEEIKWSGVESFLDGKKSVSKAELQEFVAGSMLQIEPKILSGNGTISYTEDETASLDGISEAIFDKWQEIDDLWMDKYGEEIPWDIRYNDNNTDVLAREIDKLQKNDSGEFFDRVHAKLGRIRILEHNHDEIIRRATSRTRMENGNTKTRFEKYTLDGGENYREILFKLPSSKYINSAMETHWGEEGVLAHARIQDFDVNGEKMLFIEEIQSDWHNEGHKKGYRDIAITEASQRAEDEYYKAVQEYRKARTAHQNDYHNEKLRENFEAWERKVVELADKRAEAGLAAMNGAEDAPFRNNYHEYALKSLIRMAAEQGYDSIGWTTADIQSKRWSEEYAEGYRIEYDQDIPKFLNKYGKKWGAKVGITSLENSDSTKVWSMPVTDAMRESVLYTGQASYSLKKEVNKDLNKVDVQFDAESKSVAPVSSYSLKTWKASSYVQDRETAINAIVKATGVTKKDAGRYIDNINSIARLIADDRVRLDYDSNLDETASVLKANSEYKWTVDMSTLCAKRLLYTGTFDAIQKLMPNTAFDSEDLVSLRSMMMERGYEVACGICYVESTRREIGTITADFIERYKLSQKTGKPITRVNSEGKIVELKKTQEQMETTVDKSTDRFIADKDYTPTLAELNTTDIDLVKKNHPLVYEAYLNYMNARGQAKPKLLETRAEYKGEILKHFKSKNSVKSRNDAGGLRVQSFSDFEVAHLIDMMQIVLDMSQVGLMSQAYTKVTTFAEVFGGTGMKINLSLIAKDSGLDENGNLIFDDVEGMPHEEAFRLREKYSKNVGTILVGKSFDHIVAALADSRIDFVIPFHKSSWKESLYDALGLTGYEDFTDYQNEKAWDKGRKIKNFQPSEYWDYSKSGEENAETYLQMCKKDRRTPKFPQFIGCEGYWKLLGDFKMYDNDGVGSPQMAIMPEFDMDSATEILNSYEGGHRSFPVAQDVVDDFVSQYQNKKSLSLKGAKQGKTYKEMVEEYGSIPKGEKPFRDVQVPKKTSPNKKVSQTVRTVLEAKVTPDEILPSIEKMVEDGEFSYTPYTDKQSLEDAERNVKKYGWDESLRDWFKSVEKGIVSKEITSQGWVLYNNAVNTAATATDQRLKESATNNALAILDAMVKHQRSAAQALQATRILKKLSPETQMYSVSKSVQALQKELADKYGDKAPNLKIDESLADRFLNAKTEEERTNIEKEIYKDIGRQMPSTFMDKWNAWRYLAMLGNVRTHVRNIVGNAGFAPIVATKNLTATAIESIVSRVSHKKMLRSKALVTGSKSDRALLQAAWGDYGNVADLISNGGKYNDMVMANQHIEEGRQIFKSKALEKVRKGNSQLLEMEDMWFARPHYAYALAQYCKANNITPDRIAEGRAIETAREYAIKEAQKATYRDTNAFSQMVSEWGRTNRGSKNVAKRAFGYIVEGNLPFRKTPANVFVRGVEYSPIGLLKGMSYDLVQVSKGKMMAHEAIDHVSAGLTGTGLLALGGLLAAQGLIRGHGEDEEKEKEFNEMMGHQAYSLELPNGTSITLDWLAPEALPFFVGVNIWETSNGSSEDTNLSKILSAISNISEPMLEMSCLQSLNDLFDSVGYASSGDTSALVSVLSSSVTSYLTQGIPTLLGQAERTGEENRMTTYTDKNSFLTRDMQYTIGKMSAKIPFLEYHQIPYIDAWGRKEASGPALKRGLNNFLNPAYTSTIETSNMEKELLRLYEQTRDGAVFPDRAGKYFMVDGVRKDLNADEYVRYATLKGEKSLSAVTTLVQGQAYRNLSDDEKVKAIEEAYKYADQKAKQAISNYKPDKWVSKADEFSNVGSFLSFRSEVSSTRKENDDKISKQQVADIILDMAQNDNDAWLMYLSEYESKGTLYAKEKGVSGLTYMEFIDALNDVDKPTKAEATKAIKQLSGLSRQEKAALWQSVNTTWKSYSNPWR